MVLTTVLTGLLMLGALGALWRQDGPARAQTVQEAPASPVPREAPAAATNLYRIQQLERQMEGLRGQQTWLAYLLVGNLVAVIASLVTYIVTHGRGRRA